jgi:hypothetical protein
LLPMTKARAKLSDGKEVEFEMAAFALIGDMHIRFVFDGPSYMPNAKPQDLARLNLSAEQALQLAVGNIKRVYGNPVAKPWTGGLMQVEGKSPDFDSSYFLDRAFWQGLLRQHPEGIVVAVAKRGGLLFTPITESKRSTACVAALPIFIRVAGRCASRQPSICSGMIAGPSFSLLTHSDFASKRRGLSGPEPWPRLTEPMADRKEGAKQRHRPSLQTEAFGPQRRFAALP